MGVFVVIKQASMVVKAMWCLWLSVVKSGLSGFLTLVFRQITSSF